MGKSDAEEDHSKEYEVDRICDCKVFVNDKNESIKKYLVKWSGYGSEASTWEPIENIYCQEMIEEFWDRRRKAERLRDAETSCSSQASTNSSVFSSSSELSRNGPAARTKSDHKTSASKHSSSKNPKYKSSGGGSSAHHSGHKAEKQTKDQVIAKSKENKKMPGGSSSAQDLGTSRPIKKFRKIVISDSSSSSNCSTGIDDQSESRSSWNDASSFRLQDIPSTSRDQNDSLSSKKPKKSGTNKSGSTKKSSNDDHLAKLAAAQKRKLSSESNSSHSSKNKRAKESSNEHRLTSRQPPNHHQPSKTHPTANSSKPLVVSTEGVGEGAPGLPIPSLSRSQPPNVSKKNMTTCDTEDTSGVTWEEQLSLSLTKSGPRSTYASQVTNKVTKPAMPSFKKWAGTQQVRNSGSLDTAEPSGDVTEAGTSGQIKKKQSSGSSVKGSMAPVGQLDPPPVKKRSASKETGNNEKKGSANPTKKSATKKSDAFKHSESSKSSDTSKNSVSHKTLHASKITGDHKKSSKTFDSLKKSDALHSSKCDTSKDTSKSIAPKMHNDQTSIAEKVSDGLKKPDASKKLSEQTESDAVKGKVEKAKLSAVTTPAPKKCNDINNSIRPQISIVKNTSDRPQKPDASKKLITRTESDAAKGHAERTKLSVVTNPATKRDKMDPRVPISTLADAKTPAVPKVVEPLTRMGVDAPLITGWPRREVTVKPRQTNSTSTIASRRLLAVSSTVTMPPMASVPTDNVSDKPLCVSLQRPFVPLPIPTSSTLKRVTATSESTTVDKSRSLPCDSGRQSGSYLPPSPPYFPPQSPTFPYVPSGSLVPVDSTGQPSDPRTFVTAYAGQALNDLPLPTWSEQEPCGSRVTDAGGGGGNECGNGETTIRASTGHKQVSGSARALPIINGSASDYQMTGHRTGLTSDRPKTGGATVPQSLKPMVITAKPSTPSSKNNSPADDSRLAENAERLRSVEMAKSLTAQVKLPATSVVTPVEPRSAVLGQKVTGPSKSSTAGSANIVEPSKRLPSISSLVNEGGGVRTSPAETGIQIDSHAVQKFNEDLLRAINLGDVEGVTRALSTPHYKLLDLEQVNERGSTLCMRAAMCPRGRDMLLLLVKRGANLNAVLTGNGKNSLMLAVEKESEPNVEALLQLGSYIDVGRKRSFSTALMEACKIGHLGIVKLLLGKGASFSHKNYWGHTAMDIAKLQPNREIENWLADHIANTKEEFVTQIDKLLSPYSDTRKIEILDEVFPLQCFALNENKKIHHVQFKYKASDHRSDVGVLLFIGLTLFSPNRIQCRLYGYEQVVNRVLLNSTSLKSACKKGNTLFFLRDLLEDKPNDLFIFAKPIVASEVKLLVCAYRATLSHGTNPPGA